MRVLALIALTGCAGRARVAEVLDADHDGIADAVDLCRESPEDQDGDADEDGCPDSDCPRCCSIISDRVIGFYPGQLAIARPAVAAVVQIANELRDRQELRLVQIGGNGPLGVLRAAGVRDYLIRLGVARTRLVVADNLSRRRIGDPDDNVVFAIEEGACSSGAVIEIDERFVE